MGLSVYGETKFCCGLAVDVLASGRSVRKAAASLCRLLQTVLRHKVSAKEECTVSINGDSYGMLASVWNKQKDTVSDLLNGDK